MDTKEPKNEDIEPESPSSEKDESSGSEKTDSEKSKSNEEEKEKYKKHKAMNQAVIEQLFFATKIFQTSDTAFSKKTDSEDPKSSEEKREKLKEYKERFVRWQQLSISQMSFTNNLFLVFDIGFISFFALQTGLKFSVISWLCSFQIISFLFLITSFITGSITVINRLTDFRFTERLVNDRKKKFEKNNNLESDPNKSEKAIEEINFEIDWFELLTQKLGERTWKLLNWQIWTFVIGTSIGIFYLIMANNIK